MIQLRRFLLLVSALAALGTGALAIAPSSFAAHAYYCLSPESQCASRSGPNEDPVTLAESWNESGKGVCAYLWRYNGGSNYTLLAESCTASSTYTYAFIGACPVDGHGEVAHYYSYNYWLYGYQSDYINPGEQCV